MDALVLVDSNVYIGLLRRHLDPVAILGNWIGEGDLATCGMIRLEVERGLKSPKLRRHLGGFFDVMRFGMTTHKVWEQAVELAWTLDRCGQTLPAQDLLIAATAQSFGAIILTEDAHFSMIPDIQTISPRDVLPQW